MLQGSEVYGMFLTMCSKEVYTEQQKLRTHIYYTHLLHTFTTHIYCPSITHITTPLLHPYTTYICCTHLLHTLQGGTTRLYDMLLTSYYCIACRRLHSDPSTLTCAHYYTNLTTHNTSLYLHIGQIHVDARGACDVDGVIQDVCEGVIYISIVRPRTAHC